MYTIIAYTHAGPSPLRPFLTEHIHPPLTGTPVQLVHLFCNMPLRLWAVAQLVMFLQQPVELVQGLVDGLLAQGVLLLGSAGLKGWGRPEGLGQREDLGAQESGLEVDDCGGVARHFQGNRSWIT